MVDNNIVRSRKMAGIERITITNGKESKFINANDVADYAEINSDDRRCTKLAILWMDGTISVHANCAYEISGNMNSALLDKYFPGYNKE